MPNILELRRQAAELQTEVKAKLKGVEDGQVTLKAFTDFMNGPNGAIARNTEISDGMKAYGSARSFDGLGGANGGGVPQIPGFRGKASQFAPIDVPTESLKSMHQAMTSQSSFAIQAKAFNTVDSLLPSELQQAVVGPQHETRLLDRLPVLPTSAPSIEYVRHTNTVGTPAITAEGALKPELVFTTDRVIVAAQKIACHGALSWETISDWGWVYVLLSGRDAAPGH